MWAAAAVLLATAIATVAVTRAGGAPADGTARLVPPDALLYAHVGTSPGREQDRRLVALAGRFASLRLQLQRAGMAFAPPAGALDFARDVRPWLGDEAAIALVEGGAGRPTPMLLAAVRERAGAEAMLARLGATDAGAGAHHGVALLRLTPQTTAAFAGAHLVIGPEAAVRGAIDRSAGTGAPALADARVFERAAAARDGDAGLDVLAPAEGLRGLLQDRSGPTGIAAALVTGPRLEAVSARARVERGGLRVTASVLRAPGAAAGSGAEPTLAAHVPAGSAAFADLPGLDALAGLVSRAGGASALEGLRSALPAVAGVELDDVVEPLSDELALSVAAGGQVPEVTVAARTSAPGRTRESMARLQGPLADRLAAGTPFGQRAVAGVPTFTLDVTPALRPSYGVAHDTLVVSTAPSGLAQLRPARTPVTRSRALEAVAPEEGVKVEALVFLDPRQLLALGERTGLQVLGSPAVRDDLRRIRAVGAVVQEDAYHPTDTTAELFLEIP